MVFISEEKTTCFGLKRPSSGSDNFLLNELYIIICNPGTRNTVNPGTRKPIPVHNTTERRLHAHTHTHTPGTRTPVTQEIEEGRYINTSIKQMRHAYAHAHTAKPRRQTKKPPPISSEE